MATKEKEYEFREIQNDEQVDNKLELLKYFTQVQSRNVKEEITSDFVLARLSEKDKEGIIEMTNNAYFAKRLLQEMRKATIWEWITETIETRNKDGTITKKKNGKWVLRTLTKEEQQTIQDTTIKMFNTYMIRNTTTAVLNRNVKDNYLIKLISDKLGAGAIDGVLFCKSIRKKRTFTNC